MTCILIKPPKFYYILLKLYNILYRLHLLARGQIIQNKNPPIKNFNSYLNRFYTAVDQIREPSHSARQGSDDSGPKRIIGEN